MSFHPSSIEYVHVFAGRTGLVTGTSLPLATSFRQGVRRDVPAIKIKSGKILWLAGTTALPVYHDHPHKRDEIQKYMVNDLEAQTRAAMDGIKQTLDASGASFKDVVHFFVFRARPRMGDIGKASAVINSYFAPFNHKPTSTNVAVLELGEPEQLIEIQMFAVVD